MSEEKADIDRGSPEAVKTSDSLKEKDVENTADTYTPRSDEEYNVTLKTWCVVLVSVVPSTSCTDLWLTSLADFVFVLRYQLLDRASNQLLPGRHCCSAR